MPPEIQSLRSAHHRSGLPHLRRLPRRHLRPSGLFRPVEQRVLRPPTIGQTSRISGFSPPMSTSSWSISDDTEAESCADDLALASVASLGAVLLPLFPFPHRVDYFRAFSSSSRTVPVEFRSSACREDNVDSFTSSSRTVLAAFRSSACREDIVSTSTSSSVRVYSEVVYYQSFGISSCSFGTISSLLSFS